jgi:starvation-inducible DNA-binding protein
MYCCNFVAYYRAHSCHINITGRNFYSDHKLLGKIYEDLQAQIDALGEFLRTIGEKAPETIQDILDGSNLREETTVNSADAMLQIVLESLEYLVAEYKVLFDVAEAATDQDIANYAADRIGAHSKQIWMLKATLEG